MKPQPQTIDVHRLKVPEAIEKVEQALYDSIVTGTPELRIITGQGHHSKNKIPALKLAIIGAMAEYVSQLFVKSLGMAPDTIFAQLSHRRDTRCHEPRCPPHPPALKPQLQGRPVDLVLNSLEIPACIIAWFARPRACSVMYRNV